MMVYLKLVLAMFLWGGTFVATKVIVQSMGPFSGAFCRFAIATACLLLLCYRTHGKLPRLNRTERFWVTLMGLSGVLAYNSFFFFGLKLIPASRASLIVALNPIAIAIASVFLFGETFSINKGLGIVISLVGAAVVISHGQPLELLNQGIQIGDLAMFGCVATWVAYTLATKQALVYLSSLVATTYSCMIGAIGLFFFALNEGLLNHFATVAPAAWLGVTYAGMLGTALAFTLYSDGIRALGAGRAGIFINLVPPSAITLSALILGERLTLSLFIGGAMIISGVVLTNLKSPGKPPGKPHV
jgi:drug/metabolite transporter (DMT)-like permease